MRDRELTADEYKEKLKQVEKDIETIRKIIKSIVE